MKKFFAFLSIAAIVVAACTKPNSGNSDTPGGNTLPSAAGINPVVKVEGNVVTFSLPEGTTGLIPIWYTNESGDFVFAGNGSPFTKTFFDGGTFKVRMYVSNSAGQSVDYSEAEFTVEVAKEWNGYNYNSEFNIWKKAEDTGMEDSYTYYNPGWAAEKNLAFTINPYKLTLADACSDRWQAQLHLVPKTDIALSSEKHYDFSCLITLNKKAGVTVKLTENGDDENFLFLSLDDMEEGTTIYYQKDITGIDAPKVKLVFDFGYCEAGTEVEISRITLKDHANDDGTVAPDKVEPEPEPEPEPETGDEVDPSFVFDVNGEANLWKAAIGNEKFFYYHCTGGWNGTDTETTEVPFLAKNGNSYVVSYAEATTDQWQNQLFMFPNAGSYIPLDAEKKYALRFSVSANNATHVFFKIAKFAPADTEPAKHEGETIWEWGRKSIEANTETTVTSKVITGAACDNINLIFDFGGNPANTEITIKDICLQEYNK
ncbi:MAG: hypothetical protein IK052_01585 [Bacteroidales bacterium]|nr:hypothetical protein [Bacteroidales bacterium]